MFLVLRGEGLRSLGQVGSPLPFCLHSLGCFPSKHKLSLPKRPPMPGAQPYAYLSQPLRDWCTPLLVCRCGCCVTCSLCVKARPSLCSVLTPRAKALLFSSNLFNLQVIPAHVKHSNPVGDTVMSLSNINKYIYTYQCFLLYVLDFMSSSERLIQLKVILC